MPEDQGQVPADPPADDGGAAVADEGLDPQAAKQELARARSEAAKYRSDLRTTQDELKVLKKAKDEADEAEKSELQKAIDRAQRLEADLQSSQGKLRDTTLRAEVLVAAQKAGIVDPDAAYRLLDMDRVEYDDGDKPTNIDKLLADLVDARPYLKGKAPAAAGSGTSTTQPSSGSGKRPLTRADIEKMTDDEVNANWDKPEFQKALSDG